MRALVTGGAGFAGSHLCEALLARGAEVICVDDLSTGRWRNIEHLIDRPRFSFVEHDVCEGLPRYRPLDQLYHLASPASPTAYQLRPIETLRVNSDGTRHALELCRDTGARFLYASTSEVYGDPLEHPQSEAYAGNVSPIGARSMYDEAKRFGEAITVAYSREAGVNVRIARIFNTYGPRMDPHDGRVVTNFVTQALRGGPLTVYGDGTQTRSFQYVSDLVDGLLRLMEVDYQHPVNLGSPTEQTILELAELVRELCGGQPEIVFAPLPRSDPRRRNPDITLARDLLGWEPKIGLTEGLPRTIEDVRRSLEDEQATRVSSNGRPVGMTWTPPQRSRAGGVTPLD